MPPPPPPGGPPPGAPGGPPPGGPAGPPPGWQGAPPNRWGEGDPGLPLAQRLGMYDDVLKLVRQALPLECRIPAPKTFDEALPYFAGFRAVERLLAMEAGLRREQGDFGAAAACALDGLAVAQDAKSQQTIISHLVGIACEAITFASLDETIPGLTAAQCKDVQTRLSDIMATRPSAADAFINEETWARIGLRNFLTDPALLTRVFGQMDPPMSAADLAKLQASMPQAWDLLGPYLETVAQQTTLPFRQQKRVDPPDNAWMQMEPRSTSAFLYKCARATALARLHELQLAAQAYILDKGQPPAKLSDLVPDYIKQIPEDPMTGEPLRAVTRGMAYTIYSVGPDGIDDGGRIFDNHKVFNAEEKGDIPVEVGAGTNRVP